MYVHLHTSLHTVSLRTYVRAYVYTYTYTDVVLTAALLFDHAARSFRSGTLEIDALSRAKRRPCIEWA